MAWAWLAFAAGAAGAAALGAARPWLFTSIRLGGVWGSLQAGQTVEGFFLAVSKPVFLKLHLNPFLVPPSLPPSCFPCSLLLSFPSSSAALTARSLARALRALARALTVERLAGFVFCMTTLTMQN